MNLVATRWWWMPFMPACVLMADIAVGLAWCLWSWRRGKSPRQAWPAVALAARSAFLLYLASTPLVARWAAWTLERENPAIAVEHDRRLGFTVTPPALGLLDARRGGRVVMGASGPGRGRAGAGRRGVEGVDGEGGGGLGGRERRRC
ncbi:MAG: hypothetical protein FJ270_10025 [Planctomycetes bacterium]|nr:hypothetical protein [Planctomycetota bacterium]